MPTSSFPTSLDIYTNPAANNPTNNPSLAAGQTLQNDSLVSLEAKVGINGSAVTSSLDYKVTKLQAGNLLGFATITSSFVTSALNTTVDVTGLSVTVTVPTGGRMVKITSFALSLQNNNTAGIPDMDFVIREGTTSLALASYNNRGVNVNNGAAIAISVTIPTPGVHTYKSSISISNFAGSTTVAAAPTAPAFILVELI